MQNLPTFQPIMLSQIPGVSQESPFRLPPFIEKCAMPTMEYERTRGYIGHIIWNNQIVMSQLIEYLVQWNEGGDLGFAQYIIDQAYEYEKNDEEINNHIDLVSAFVVKFIFDHQDHWEDNPIVISHFDCCRELGLMIAKKTLKPDVDWDNPVIKHSKQYAYDLDRNNTIHGFTCHKSDEQITTHLSTRIKDLCRNGPYSGEFFKEETIGYAETVSDMKNYIYAKMTELFL